MIHEEKTRNSRGLAALLAAIVLVIGADVAVDLLEGGSASHAAVELVAMAMASVGVAMLVRELTASHDRALRLAHELATSHRDAERYRAEAAELLGGLGRVIDDQLERWHLTAAEKEVAVLLLKGLSLREIAEVRETTERTARKQAHAVYDKAGLDGRATLSAFFLEDLLPPRTF